MLRPLINKIYLINQEYQIVDNKKDINTQIRVELNGSVDGESLIHNFIGFANACGFDSNWFIPLVKSVAESYLEPSDSAEVEEEMDLEIENPLEIIEEFLDEGLLEVNDIIQLLNKKTDQFISSFDIELTEDNNTEED